MSDNHAVPLRPTVGPEHHTAFSNADTRIKGVPTFSKYKRDAIRLKEHARWVIVIDEFGNLVEMLNNKQYVANVIAVLGPAVVWGKPLSEAVLLEIGISRGKPYTKAEAKVNGRVRQMKGRTKAGDLSLLQYTRIWSTLTAFMEECVLVARAKWKTKGPWTTRTAVGLKDYERGIYFTIASCDAPLLEAFLRRDVAGRKYLVKRKAHFVRYFLRTYKFAFCPEKKLKALVGVHKVVDLWRNMTSSNRWSPRYTRAILRALPPTTGALFQQIAQVFNLAVNQHDPDPELVPFVRNLRFPAYLGVRLDGVGKVHGKNCSVFEVYFSREYREKHGI